MALPIALPQDPGLYEQGQRMRLRGDEVGAVACFRAVLRSDPEQLDAHVAYQKVLQSQQRDAELIEEYGQRLETRRTALSLYLYGRLLLDWRKQEELYREGLALDAQNAELQVGLVDALRKQRRFAAAIEVSREFLVARPAELALHQLHCRALLDAQRRKELLDRYRAIGEQPGDWFKPYLAACALFFAGEEEESFRLLASIEQQATASRDFRRRWALAQAAAGKIAYARRLLDDQVAADPGHVGTIVARAQVLLESGEAQQAVDQMRLAVRLEPAEADYRLLLAVALHAVGELEDAVAEAEAALRFDPSYHQAMSVLGSMLLQDGRREEGIAWRERAVQSGPDVTWYLHSLASVIDDPARSRELLERAEQIAYERMATPAASADGRMRRLSALQAKASRRAMLGWIHLDSARTEAAEESFERALELDPQQFRATWGLARVAEMRRDWAAAAARYLRCSDLEQAEPDWAAAATLHRAEMLRRSGDRPAALELYRELASDEPGRFAHALDLPELVRNLERPSVSEPVIELTGIPHVFAERRNHCGPVAVTKVLRFWRRDVTLATASEELIETDGRGATSAGIVAYLRSNGLIVIPFRSDPDAVRSVLRAGFPVILLHSMSSGSEWAGHASVIDGFDPAAQFFLLSEQTRSGSEQRWLQASRIGGNVALLAAPADRIRGIAARLPGRAAARLAIDLTDPASTTAAVAELQNLEPEDMAALPQLVWYSATQAAQRGEPGVARASIASVVASRWFDPPLRLAVASELGRLGDHDRSRQALRALVRELPTFAAASAELSAALESGDGSDPAAAAEALVAALRFAPEDPLLRERLGRRKLLGADYGGAEREFRAAIAAGASPRAHLMLAVCLLQRGRRDLAAARAKRCLAMDLAPEDLARANELLELCATDK